VSALVHLSLRPFARDPLPTRQNVGLGSRLAPVRVFRIARVLIIPQCPWSIVVRLVGGSYSLPAGLESRTTRVGPNRRTTDASPVIERLVPDEPCRGVSSVAVDLEPDLERCPIERTAIVRTCSGLSSLQPGIGCWVPFRCSPESLIGAA
jgi:hypothetical protein